MLAASDHTEGLDAYSAAVGRGRWGEHVDSTSPLAYGPQGSLERGINLGV